MNDVMTRINKLLTLAESPNENEAQVALVKARALMAQYKISQDEITAPVKNKVVRFDTGLAATKRGNQWLLQLVDAMSPYYCCRTIVVRTKGQQTYLLRLIGFEEDTRICNAAIQYAAAYVQYRISEIYKRYQHVSRAALRPMTDGYALGFIKGIRQALDKQNAAEQGDGCCSLVLKVPTEVDNALKNIGSVPFQKKKIDEESYKDGLLDGQQFDVNRKQLDK